MPTSEARQLANKANAQHSTGPRTDEGKARSRCNSLKHGLTGAGVVLPNEDAAEVERRFVSLNAEMRPATELGRTLVQRLATLSVRMDRSVSQETAALSVRVRQAEADFQAPEGSDADTTALLRAEAGALALFDPSKEATLARRYEAAAERGFFRALKEFRQVEREANAPAMTIEGVAKQETLGSFMQLEKLAKLIDKPPAEPTRPTPPARPKTLAEEFPPSPGGYFELPFSIGKAS